MRARKPPDWLVEERRSTLGQWAAFCLSCGHTLRWFEEGEADLPVECPHCGGAIRARCPGCSVPFASAFATECEACRTALRSSDVQGIRIRRGDDR